MLIVQSQRILYWNRDFVRIPISTLILILKQTNNYSTNISADVLFKKLGGEKNLANI